MNVEQLNQDALFEEQLSQVSTWRRDRICSLRFRKDRNLSLGASILLREGLQRYGLREKEMQYDLTAYGKPVLSAHPQIHFSLSHSGEMAVAVFSDGEVGCDIEKIDDREEENLIRIANRFFSKKEYTWMMAQKEEAERRKAFYQLWTRKESYLKAFGTGLSELDRIREKTYEQARFSEEVVPGYICTICEME